jgi:hypothetical protein
MQLPIAEVDIVIFQGATFDQTLFWEIGEPPEAVNLSGYTGKLQVRTKPASKAVIIELSTENGRMTLNETTGSIRLFISASDTAALSAQNAVYDLELTTGYVVSRLLQGNVIIAPEVTR